MVRNIHERALVAADPAAVAALIDGLGSAGDRLWPIGRWPAIRLDGPLAVGARGGHGPIRYAVSDYEPGRRACFRFAPDQFDGHHWAEVTTLDGRVVLRHVLQARPRGAMRLLWPVAIRWLHDALIEDALDRAVAGLDGGEPQPRRLCRWVRVLRAALRRTGRASA